MAFIRAIITLGGACSSPKNSDGPQKAAVQAMQDLSEKKSALTAVVTAVKSLENDPRFNAGVGSQLRDDGKTFQLDAACMTSREQFGAVACVEGVQNPIELAEEVLHSPHVLLTGQGAHLFATLNNIKIKPSDPIQNPQQKNKNRACDTVGALAFDGKVFAAALSSGGIAHAPLGRVGDVPLPGCGLYCGPIGAVACTGDGEFIVHKILAREVYGWLESGMTSEKAAAKALTLFDTSVEIGLIILTKNDFAANSGKGMAWSHLVVDNQ